MAIRFSHVKTGRGLGKVCGQVTNRHLDLATLCRHNAWRGKTKAPRKETHAGKKRQILQELSAARQPTMDRIWVQSLEEQ